MERGCLIEKNKIEKRINNERKIYCNIKSENSL